MLELDKNLNYLCRAFLSFQTEEECVHFLEDLCSASEIEELKRRFLAARMLDKNYVYKEIAEETGLSTATISRVNHCLKFGDGGYKTAIDRLSQRASDERKYDRV